MRGSFAFVMRMAVALAAVGVWPGTAGLCSAATFRLWIQSTTPVFVVPGGTVGYQVTGGGEGEDWGLATIGFDIETDTGVPQVAAQSGPAIAGFVRPAGFTNPDPAGFGGTADGDDLRGLGGAQNTIGNDGVSPNPPYPNGPVTLHGGGGPVVIATGQITLPQQEGTYTVSLANAFAGVLMTGSPPYLVEEATIRYMSGSFQVTVGPLPVHNLTQGTDWGSIQAAIDAADDDNHNVIEISPGIYHEQIDLSGTNLTLRSTNPQDSEVVAATIIDGSGLELQVAVVTFDGPGSNACILDGLTITGGTGAAGIEGDWTWEDRTQATIRNCIIRDNNMGIIRVDGPIENCVVRHNSNGGGLVYCDGTIRNCTIIGNSCRTGGGVGWCTGTLENCLIAGNSSLDGGGIGGPAPAVIRGCTIVNNYAFRYGGNLYVYSYAPCTLTNSIVYGTANPLLASQFVFNTSGPGLTVSYSDIQGGQAAIQIPATKLTWGSGNTNQDPLFASEGPFVTLTAEYSTQTFQTTLTLAAPVGTNLVGQLVNPDLTQGVLFLVAGQTETTLTVWGDASAIVQTGDGGAAVTGHLDAGSSPCVNAGDPAGDYTGQTDIDGQARVQDGRIEMGCDEVDQTMMMSQMAPAAEPAAATAEAISSVSLSGPAGLDEVAQERFLESIGLLEEYLEYKATQPGQ